MTFKQSLESPTDGESVSKIANINKKAYDKLTKIHNKSNTILDVYTEITKSVKKVFGSLYRVDSDNSIVDIKIVYANPERSVAKQVQEDNMVLPIISFDQDISNSDLKRSRYNPVLVHNIVWDDSKQRATRVLSLAPAPVTISFKISIWSKYAEDLDQVLEQITLMFNPSLNLPNKFSDETQAFLTEEENETESSYKDGSDRVLRRTIEMQVETYIPGPRALVTSTGEIESIPHVEFDVTTLTC
tara:strand:- start:4239 stop:4970 length:732 start_codon:yes stop_codon:yes gene_type:complete